MPDSQRQIEGITVARNFNAPNVQAFTPAPLLAPERPPGFRRTRTECVELATNAYDVANKARDAIEHHGPGMATSPISGGDAMPRAENYSFIYVNADGTARELHPNERQYLETEFLPGDGAAPSVKDSYAERNGWGEITGYLMRSRLPPGTLIQDAPEEDPRQLMSATELVEWLRNKGVRVT
jgi:hypothetical protein